MLVAAPELTEDWRIETWNDVRIVRLKSPKTKDTGYVRRTIGEFRLLAQNYPAEFGRSLDGILNVVFKSGTNEFHGEAFEFLRL